MPDLGRRAFIRSAGAGVALAACAPTAPAPLRQTAPATGMGWEKQWEDLVAAARAEGKVSVLTLVGAGYRRAMDAFEGAFPGVTVEHEAPASMGPFSQKIIQERK